MVTLNVRLDDKLRNKAYTMLEKLNITSMETVRLLFQYVTETERTPVETITLSDSEGVLIQTVREGLASP